VALATTEQTGDGDLGRTLAVAAGVVAGAGTIHLARRLPSDRRWLLVAVLASAGASWTAVPETSTVLPILGVVAAVAVAALLAAPVTAGGCAVLAVAVGLAALAGEPPTDLRRAGAVACLGLLLWWPAGQIARTAIERATPLPGLRPGGWLLAAHTALALLAARWVAAAPDATATRLVVIAIVGTVIAAMARPSVTMET
jgi:hypothetical protein